MSGAGLFSVWNEKFKPQLNKIILLLQYYKLSRDENEIAEEGMGQFELAKIVSHFLWIYHASQLFTLDLPFDSLPLTLLETLNFTDYCVMHKF